MLIVEEIRKVYAENYHRSYSSFGFTVCLTERERGGNKREGNSKNINMQRGEGRLFYNCDIIGAFCLKLLSKIYVDIDVLIIFLCVYQKKKKVVFSI